MFIVEKLFFFIAIGVTYAFARYPKIREGISKRLSAILNCKPHLQPLVLYILGIALLIALPLGYHWIQDARLPPALQTHPLNKVQYNFLITASIGAVCGILLSGIMSRLASISRKKSGPNSDSGNQNNDGHQETLIPDIIFVSLFLVLFIIGFFQPELETLFRNAKQISTPYFDVQINESKTEEGIFSWEKKGSGGLSTSTDFQTGANTFIQAVNTAEKDLDHINRICKYVSTAYCKTYPTVDTYSKKIIEDLIDIKTYMDNIKPLALCFQNYSIKFPNGVPIQDELSELAATYATVEFEAKCGDNSETSKNVKQDKTGSCKSSYVTNINTVVEKIKHGLSGKKEVDKISFGDLEKKIPCKCLYTNSNTCGRYWTEVEKKCKEKCTDSKTNDCKNYGDQLQEVLTYQGKLTQHRRTPHRTAIESAIMTSAGYPAEAATHIESQFKNFIRLVNKNKLPKKASDKEINARMRSANTFYEFLLKQRYLYFLASAMFNIKEYKNSNEYYTYFSSLTDRWLNQLAKVSIKEPQLAIAMCNANFKAGFKDNIQWILFEDANEKGKEKVRQYVIDQLYASLSQELRRMYNKAENLSSMSIEELNFHDDLHLAKKFFDLAGHNFHEVSSCFQDSTSDPHISSMRVHMASQYGFLLAARVKNRIISGESFSKNEKENLCHARAALDFAKDITKYYRRYYEEINDDDNANVFKEHLYEIRKWYNNSRLNRLQCE